MKVLAICGSIRKGSSNHKLLSAVKSLFPNLSGWVDFDIGSLPFFNPDLQFNEIPSAVVELRAFALQSEFIVVATPEYAHGIPGILKNALEWLVCEETMKKRVIVFIAAPSGGDYVKPYLLETLRTMDLIVTNESTMVVRTARSSISNTGAVQDPELHAALMAFLKNVVG